MFLFQFCSHSFSFSPKVQNSLIFQIQRIIRIKFNKFSTQNDNKIDLTPKKLKNVMHSSFSHLFIFWFYQIFIDLNSLSKSFEKLIKLL